MISIESSIGYRYSTLIAAKKICLGQDVMIGRGVVIYDSDHHTIRDAQGEVTNPDVPVSIGDHVWLATNMLACTQSAIHLVHIQFLQYS